MKVLPSLSLEAGSSRIRNCRIIILSPATDNPRISDVSIIKRLNYFYREKLQIPYENVGVSCKRFGRDVAGQFKPSTVRPAELSRELDSTAFADFLKKNIISL